MLHQTWQTQSQSLTKRDRSLKTSLKSTDEDNIRQNMNFSATLLHYVLTVDERILKIEATCYLSNTKWPRCVKTVFLHTSQCSINCSLIIAPTTCQMNLYCLSKKSQFWYWCNEVLCVNIRRWSTIFIICPSYLHVIFKALILIRSKPIPLLDPWVY